ncbi:MAG: hypothetical protein ABIV50_04190 [Opitutus sp.]
MSEGFARTPKACLAVLYVRVVQLRIEGFPERYGTEAESVVSSE